MDEHVITKGMKACREQDWKAFDAACCFDAEHAAYLMSYCENRVPKDVLCKIALFHYANHGDHSPIIRKYVRMARPYRPDNWRDDMPETVRDLDTFVVYRAGSEPLEKAKYSISWSLLRDTAEWFAARHAFRNNGEQRHLYKATISADKIISYIAGRQEFEVVQYRNVKNVEEIPSIGPSDEFTEIFNAKTDTFKYFEPHSHPLEQYFNRWYLAEANK